MIAVELRPAREVTRAPAWAVPSGGWDTHAHVFGPPDRYPLRPDRRYTPALQGVGAYLETLDRLGLRHGVLVQPSVYAQDNTCLLDALDAAPDRLVGVVDLDVLAASTDELHALTSRGVRGLRVAWRPGDPLDRLRALAARLAELGWHLDLRVEDADQWPALAPTVAELDLPVVVESMGSPRGFGPGFAAFLALLRHPHVWVKLSHAYQLDPAGPPYDATVGFARAVLAVAADRCVWGSDWPHPMRPDEPMPDDTDLLDLLRGWAVSTTEAGRVLANNPARLYGPTTEGN